MSATDHVEWIRAALRDELRLTDEGGTVTLDANQLHRLAEVARAATLTWMLGTAKNHPGDTHVHVEEDLP